MEKLKNNIISEENLNKIIGGIKLNKENISEKAKLIAATTVILTGIGTTLGTCLYLDQKHPIKLKLSRKNKKTH